jgi:DNA-binding transcriptional ArsR family regulator
MIWPQPKYPGTVLELRFGADDLLRCRFAMSPVWETTAALEALWAPGRSAALLPWLRAAAPRVAELPLDPLRALLDREGASGYVPDFISPPPTGPLDDIADGLEAIRATPPRQVKRELEWAFEGRRLPAVATAMLNRPSAARDRIAELIALAWDRLLADEWPQLRDLLDGDILMRSGQLAAGGLESMLGDLHRDVSWRAGAVRVRSSYAQVRDLGGAGLVFVPSAFTPAVRVMLDPPWQPTLIYPARGAALLGHRRTQTGGSLGDLLGRTRATILGELTRPAGTTTLARRLTLAPGTVSEHLAVLRGAGLAHAHRNGREVRYSLTPLGHAVLAGDR